MHQPSIRIDHIGRDRHPVVVVDDFSPHPDRLVEDARTCDFTVMGPYYPGVRAPVSPLYFEGLAAALTPILRDVFEARSRVAFDRALYSIATTPPHDLALYQRIPHIDGVEPEMIAIVHYLSRDDLGGTAFYRHRSTGYEAVAPNCHRAYLDALKNDLEHHGEPPAAYIAGDTPIFEQIAAYEPAFNRALIYRGNMLHCACLSNEPKPATMAEQGRLTVASFLSAV